MSKFIFIHPDRSVCRSFSEEIMGHAATTCQTVDQAVAMNPHITREMDAIVLGVGEANGNQTLIDSVRGSIRTLRHKYPDLPIITFNTGKDLTQETAASLGTDVYIREWLDLDGLVKRISIQLNEMATTGRLPPRS